MRGKVRREYNERSRSGQGAGRMKERHAHRQRKERRKEEEEEELWREEVKEGRSGVRGEKE